MEQANEMSEEEELLTLEEAAERLKLGVQELRMMLRYKRIPSVRLSRSKWRVKKSVVTAILTGELTLWDGSNGKRTDN